MVIQYQVHKRFVFTFRESIYKPLPIRPAYLVPNGAETAKRTNRYKTPHSSVSLVKWSFGFTLIIHVLQQVYYS